MSLKFKDAFYLPSGRIFLLETEDGYPIECTEMRDVLIDSKEHNEVRTTLDPKIIWQHLQPYDKKWLLTVSTQKGCPHNCQFCLVPGSPILMQNFNSIPIEEVKLNDIVWVPTPSNEFCKYPAQYATKKYVSLSKVTGLIKRVYSGEVFSIKTKSGLCIEWITQEHPVYVLRKGRFKATPANELSVGDTVLSFKSASLSPTNINWERGWLAGMADGDMYRVFYTNTMMPRMSLMQNNIEVVAFAKSILDKYGINTSAINPVKNKGNGGYIVTWGGKAVVEFDNFINDGEQDEDYMRGYIAGFWDAEGANLSNGDCVRAYNKNIAFLNKAESYCHRLGYISAHVVHSSGCSYIQTGIRKFDFITKFRPQHPKSFFWRNQNKTRWAADTYGVDTIIEIQKKQYCGVVHNIETEMHSYFTGGVANHNCDVAPLPFEGNLTRNEILAQVQFLIRTTPYAVGSQKVKIGFARMGEPAHNLQNVLDAIRELLPPYEKGKTVEIVGGTMPFCNFKWLPCFNSILPRKTIEGLSGEDVLKRVIEFKETVCDGFLHLQVSCNSTNEETRQKLFGGANVLTLPEIISIVNQHEITSRTVTLNFIVMQGVEVNVDELVKMGLNPSKFTIKLIPLNRTENSGKHGLETFANYNNYDDLKQLAAKFEQHGLPVVFDAIAKCEEAGLCCGQLAHINGE